MIPFRVLFWNINTKASPALIAQLAVDYRPDIIALAESQHNEADIVNLLKLHTGFLYQIPLNITKRFQFFVRLPSERVRVVRDSEYLTIRHIQPILGQDFLLAVVHFPSKLRQKTEDQQVLCTRWARYINEVEQQQGHARTLVIGDFNMNPFEAGIVGSEGFHAVSSKAVAAKETRKVQSEIRPFFYNPMWSMMGDAIGCAGTYYYQSNNPVTYFWNTFDQVLLRPALAQNFSSGDVAIIAEAGGESFLNSNDIPNKAISDHLPIIATLRL